MGLLNKSTVCYGTSVLTYKSLGLIRDDKLIGLSLNNDSDPPPALYTRTVSYPEHYKYNDEPFPLVKRQRN